MVFFIIEIELSAIKAKGYSFECKNKHFFAIIQMIGVKTRFN